MGSQLPDEREAQHPEPVRSHGGGAVATKTSIPWITDITAISVVVDRMMPSSVRKLRSLLARSESKATVAASKKEAWDFT